MKKKSGLSILDCTLRDGGYINNWSFSEYESKTIIDELVKANLEIIEIGFLQNKPHSLDKTIFNNILRNTNNTSKL